MDNRQFADKAKELLSKYLIKKGVAPLLADTKNLFIVWSAKILQNNKAILATDNPDDQTMYEITYNGDKEQFYLDAYKKTENVMYHNDK